MGVLAIAMGVAVLAVVATRGSFRALAELPFRAFGFLFVALGVQLGLEWVELPADRIGDVGLALLLLSYALILGFCLLNLRIRGMAIVAIGIAMNALVIGLNQGMPTKVPERALTDGTVVEEDVERTVKHRPEEPDDLLPSLGDIIVLPEPLDAVISFGDLVLAVGLVDVAFWGSRRPRRRAGRARAVVSDRSAGPEAAEVAAEVVEPEPVEVIDLRDDVDQGGTRPPAPRVTASEAPVPGTVPPRRAVRRTAVRHLRPVRPVVEPGPPDLTPYDLPADARGASRRGRRPAEHQDGAGETGARPITPPPGATVREREGHDSAATRRR